MAIIYYVVCIRKVYKLGSTLNFINILQPVYFFNVFLHGNFLQCKPKLTIQIYSLRKDKIKI